MTVPNRDRQFMTDQQRNAIVTGGAGGIGAAISRRLVSEGYRVVVWDSGTPDPASMLDAVTYRVVDVADQHSVRAAAEACESLDLLVNAAGIAGPRDPIAQQNFEVWDRVLAVNLSGPFYCAISLFAALREGEGVVVNITSIASAMMQEGRAHYAVAKGGLATLTRSLAYEWAPHNVRVIGVSPGYCRTPMVVESIVANQLDEAFLNNTSRRGRMVEPEEVASVVATVASDDFGFVTGEVITVDGGGTLGWIRPTYDSR